MRWCLEPALRQSVGFGPVFFPRAPREPSRCRSRSSAGRGARGDGARPAGSRGAVATPRCAATGPGGANTSARPAAHLACGSICQGMPARRTKRMPVRIVAVRNRDPAVPVATLRAPLRDQRFQARPDRIIDEGLRHARPYQAARLRTRAANGVLKRALKNLTIRSRPGAPTRRFASGGSLSGSLCPGDPPLSRSVGTVLGFAPHGSIPFTGTALEPVDGQLTTGDRVYSPHFLVRGYVGVGANPVPADPRVKTEIAAIDAQIAEADSENGKYGGAGKGPD